MAHCKVHISVIIEIRPFHGSDGTVSEDIGLDETLTVLVDEQLVLFGKEFPHGHVDIAVTVIIRRGDRYRISSAECVDSLEMRALVDVQFALGAEIDDDQVRPPVEIHILPLHSHGVIAAELGSLVETRTGVGEEMVLSVITHCEVEISVIVVIAPVHSKSHTACELRGQSEGTVPLVGGQVVLGSVISQGDVRVSVIVIVPPRHGSGVQRSQFRLESIERKIVHDACILHIVAPDVDLVAGPRAVRGAVISRISVGFENYHIRIAVGIHITGHEGHGTSPAKYEGGCEMAAPVIEEDPILAPPVPFNDVRVAVQVHVGTFDGVRIE